MKESIDTFISCSASVDVWSVCSGQITPSYELMRTLSKPSCEKEGDISMNSHDTASPPRLLKDKVPVLPKDKVHQ